MSISNADALGACERVGRGVDILTPSFPPAVGAAGPITTGGPTDVLANSELLPRCWASWWQHQGHRGSPVRRGALGREVPFWDHQDPQGGLRCGLGANAMVGVGQWSLIAGGPGEGP